MRPVRRTRRSTSVIVAAAALALAGSLSGPGAALAVTPPAADVPEPPADSALFAEPSATDTTLARGTSSVTVSRTAALSRQMLRVSWAGMVPTPGGGINPMMVMQCRGSNPGREDCWTGTTSTSDAAIGGAFSAVYSGHHLPAETSQWPFQGLLGQQMRIPFRKADGTYLASPGTNGRWNVFGLEYTGTNVVPVDDYSPASANFRPGWTGPDGKGQLQTWVNTGRQNPSLGCSDTTECSLVIVPVTKPACRTELTGNAAINCQSTKATIHFWQLLANWNQRYVFKLSFSPEAVGCAQRDDSAALTGSELVAEAMRQWVPARCQTSSPAGLDYTRAWETDARRLAGQRTKVSPSGFAADGAVVSEPATADDPASGQRKAAYAPIAVSGFAIGFQWDVNGAGDPVPEVKLNPRLMAKLLTQSYPGKYRVDRYGHPVNPNIPTNPAVLGTDPEFVQLNPGANTWQGHSSPVGTQLVLPTAKTDVMLAVTRWLWSDPEARAFLQGKPDPWGMTVNKAYRDWTLPRDDYGINDGWLIPADHPTAGLYAGYAPQQLGSQLSSSWAQSAEVAMTAWPLAQIVTAVEPGSDVLTTKRTGGQLRGTRNVLALSTTSELEKVGLPMAALKNSAGEYVKPDVQSLHYGLDGATVDKTSGVWQIDQAGMDKRGYPGTMISYAMVPTTGLAAASAARYAGTIRWMSTAAQQYGRLAGQLPDGYLSLTDPMRDQAAKVATAVETQSGTVPVPDEDPLPDDKDPTPDDPPPANGGGPGSSGGQGAADPGTGTGTGDTGGGGNDTGTGTGVADLPGGTGTTGPTTPSASPTTGASTPPAGQTKTPVPVAADPKKASATTRGESLGWLSWGIPALLLAGLVAGVASPGIRILAEPGNPVRRGIVAGGNAVARLVRRGTRRRP